MRSEETGNLELTLRVSNSASGHRSKLHKLWPSSPVGKWAAGRGLWISSDQMLSQNQVCHEPKVFQVVLIHALSQDIPATLGCLSLAPFLPSYLPTPPPSSLILSLSHVCASLFLFRVHLCVHFSFSLLCVCMCVCAHTYVCMGTHAHKPQHSCGGQYL